MRVARLIEAGADAFVAVKGATEAELLCARQRCKGIGWRGEVACDAELIAQSKTLKGGRGKIDAEGIGTGAALKAQALKTRDSVSTIKLNVRIFNVFFKTKLKFNLSLEDKGFYQAALRSPKPLAALEYFTKQFAADESFTITDAYQWSSEQRAKCNESSTKVLAAVRASQKDKSLAAFLREASAEISALQARCPDKDFAKRFFPQFIEEIEDQLAVMAEQHAEDACRLAWERGYYRENQIALFTSLSRQVVSVTMNRLSESQEFYEVEEHTHGKHDRRWQKAGMAMVGDASSRKVG